MLFHIDPGSSVPLGDQIAVAARAAIASGGFAPGDRLPAARSLADSLGVNVHTVLRGYQRLRDEGLIELRRGRGAVVSRTDTVSSRAALLPHARALVAEARSLWLGESEVLELVREILADPA
ncbi:GntR family transcriptional regulator [Streptomyces sp. NPDC058374]|uniref:GntR family transcriptional regulator n=1 Tax=Streptomyces sp. NPDC058374 TaxID=3346466 RepID=UPI0036520746